VGVAHFAEGTTIPRDELVRRFAFRLMDVRGCGAIDRVRYALRDTRWQRRASRLR
jgi:hypothetical protein